MPAWTSEAAVVRALGDGSGASDDPYLADVVAAANSMAFTKRLEAGYDDDPDDTAPAPNAAVALGTTTLAVDFYRARGSGDAGASYGEIDGFVANYGGWANVRRLLGIGRAQVDTVRADAVVTPLRFWMQRPAR